MIVSLFLIAALAVSETYAEVDECINSNGADYLGNVAVTENGNTCMNWADKDPHAHDKPLANFPDAVGSLAEIGNKCRNPDGESRPWCYTIDPDIRWEFCNIPACTGECYTGDGSNYLGTETVTENGNTCMKWADKDPHDHDKALEQFPDAVNSLSQIGNKCRNPDGEPRPWCYTTDPDIRWEFCDVPVCPEDPCDPNPCLNGGTCVSDGGDFECQCTTWWQGDTCDNVEERPCDFVVCQNGGTCTDVDPDNYLCDCPDGFEGDDCENEIIDPCDPNPCLNGGTCVPDGEEFECQCTTWWQGDTCDNVEERPCDFVLCQNGGTCTDIDPDNYLCDCPDGFEGDDCENEIDPCQQPLDEGTGFALIMSYYYDANKGKCKRFEYLGFGGNLNRFETKKACKAACVQKPAFCFLPKDTGAGEEKKVRYFYNSETDKCKKMKYKGNAGNDNNFSTREECRTTCKY